SRRRHTRSTRDWSSDVCSSDLPPVPKVPAVQPLTLPAHPRVLVFAPHPDDESLAAGGLITRLVHAGDAVRVVFVTNGDGYPWAEIGRASCRERVAGEVADWIGN